MYPLSMMRLALRFSPVVLLAACLYPEQSDYGGVCVTAKQDGDKHVLVITADSLDCASDHKGASFECSISVDGSHAHVETTFKDGKDPNHACANSLMTTCEVEVEPGSYTIEFADEDSTLEVPSAEVVCLGG